MTTCILLYRYTHISSSSKLTVRPCHFLGAGRWVALNAKKIRVELELLISRIDEMLGDDFDLLFSHCSQFAKWKFWVPNQFRDLQIKHVDFAVHKLWTYWRVYFSWIFLDSMILKTNQISNILFLVGEITLFLCTLWLWLTYIRFCSHGIDGPFMELYRS